MEKVTIQDLLGYKIIQNIQVVNHTLYGTLKEMDEKENKYISNIVKYDTQKKEFVKFTSDNQVFGFEVEGDDLLFTASREKSDEAEDNEEKTVFYRLSTTGGEAQKAVTFEMNVSLCKKLNEKYLVVVVERNWAKKNLSKEALEDEKDYVVLHEVPFVANGAGFIDGTRNNIALYNIETKEVKWLMDDFFDTERVEVANGKVYFTGKSWKDVCHTYAGLYAADENTVECLIEPKYHLGEMKVATKGIYFMATDMILYEFDTSCDFHFYDFETKTETKLADFDYGIGNGSGSDVASFGESFVLNQDLYFIATIGHHGQLYTLRNNKVKKVFDFDGAVCGFAMDGKKIYFTGMENGKLPEVYCYEKKTITQLSNYSSVLENKSVQKVIYKPFTNRLGMKIDGWIIEPVGYEKGKKYPAILDIHGGPRAAYSDIFFHEMQVWANEGYFVFFCNPQGSDGYGDKFADMRCKYGTIDYDDFMDFTDFVLSEVKDIDETRLGVTGGSYGGFMTNWIITHTHRFACAATQRSIANWVSDYGTSGISYEDALLGHARPWKGMERMWEASPLKTIDFCTTPTLIIHSFEDFTCAVSQAYELFTSLKMLGVETRACLFKGENHGLSRNGKPKHRLRRLKEITDWMNQHLKNYE